MSEAASAGEFSVKDVARLFELAEARLRYWAQTGFVGPSVRRGGRFFYSFQDLIGVKVAKDLLDRGLSLQAVRRSLESLRASLPHVDKPLSSLRIVCDGDRLLVAGAGEDAAFEPTTGQTVMSFAVSALEERVAEILPIGGASASAGAPAPAASPAVAPAASAPAAAVAPVADEPPTAYAAFLAGVAAEDAGDWAGAERLYRRATVLDAELAAAWTNLGSALERRGVRGEARAAFDKALALDPEQPEARYNLANLLADVGEHEHAVAEYRRVVAACPEFADAHFNLALALAKTGAVTAATAHLGRYLELDDGSPWAARARELLAELTAGAPTRSLR